MRLNKGIRKKKIPYSINFVPALIAWTTVPKTLKALFYQRERWQRGTLQCIWRKKSMIFNPYYGKEGMLGMPYLIAETLGCLLEFTCYVLIPILIAFGILNWMIAALFILISFALGIIRTTLTNLIEQLTFRRYPKTSDVLRILFCGFLENFGFHQAVLFSRIQAFGRAFKRDRSWRREETVVEETQTQKKERAAG